MENRYHYLITRRNPTDYIHEVIDDDNEIQSISGYYTVEKELKLECGEKLFLCIIGVGVVDSSCCGVGGCRYALVPGYIIEWKERTNSAGFMVSKVEPVVEENTKKKISKIIKEREFVTQVNFW